MKELRKSHTKEQLAALLTQSLAFHIAIHSINENELETGIDLFSSMLKEHTRLFYMEKIKRN
jgi:hypothetical protein